MSTAPRLLLLGGRRIILEPEFDRCLTRLNVDPQEIVTVGFRTLTVRGAGRWCNGVDLEPWNQKVIPYSAECTLMLRDNREVVFEYGLEKWASSEPIPPSEAVKRVMRKSDRMASVRSVAGRVPLQAFETATTAPRPTPQAGSGCRHLGVMGTLRSPTDAQLKAARVLLQIRLSSGFTHLHHGGRVGTDASLHQMATEMGFKTVSHPARNPKTRARLVAAECLAPMDAPARNRVLFRAVEEIVFFPDVEMEGEYASTWVPVREIRRAGRPGLIIWPNGKESDLQNRPGAIHR